MVNRSHSFILFILELYPYLYKYKIQKWIVKRHHTDSGGTSIKILEGQRGG